MRKGLLIIFFLCLGLTTQAQDVPIFTQKLTNSFFYNPAVAGHTFGSITLSHRQNFDQSITNNFFSIHSPLANHKIGVGATMFTDEFSFINRSYFSAAAAYHINFSRYHNLSFGLSGDFTLINIDTDRINFDAGAQDPLLAQIQNENAADVSFGMHYQTRYFKVGVAANRMIQNWVNNEENLLFDGYMSFMGAGLIPMRMGEDILEPRFTYIQSRNENLWNTGLYYTYNNALMIGAGLRQNDIISLSTSFKFAQKYLVGITHEIANGNLNLGSTTELALRIDFADLTYKDRFRQDYRDAVNYRRKSLNSSRGRKMGSANPQKARKKQIKQIKRFKSPNARYRGTRTNRGNQTSIGDFFKNLFDKRGGKAQKQRKKKYKKMKRTRKLY